MSDAIDRILLGRNRLVDAYTQQHESDAEAARAYAEDILRSDPLALTAAEATRRLSVSVSTIGAMIADKRLPCVRLVGRKGSRGRVLVRTADLDALLRDPPVPCPTGPQMCACIDETGCRYSHLMQLGTLARARAEEETFLPVRKSSKKSKGGAMTERIPTPLAAKRVVYTDEELYRKREGTWDATTMVSVTSPEGAALLALQRASPEKVTVAQEVAVERLKNETPPHEPTSPTVENETTKAELLPPAKAATSETEGPKTETSPLAAMGSKRSRSGGRQLKKQKLPAEISELGRKRSPERMRIFLDSLAEDAVLIHATNKAGLHRRTPEYWLKCSAAGHDGYDVEWRGVTMKFHEHYISAMEEGGDIEEVAFRLATGYDEILTYKGRVSYKIDLVLWSLGRRGPDANLKDENGDPVPETVRKFDPKMIRWLLARHDKRPKTDVTQKSGVLVVGVPSKTEVTVAQAELPLAKVPTSEAEGPKTETTPLGAMGSKRSRSGGRQLKKQKLPAEISELGRKRSPERMRIFLDSLAEYPALIYATKKAGIHRRTPEYWLKCSAAGHEGYDLEWRGETAKFHEHYISAIDEGGGHLEEVAFRLAKGYDEILTYKGRVSYKIDLVLSSLGHQGPDAYKKDENGNPVPETVPKCDLKMARWLLERRLPDKYGKDRKMDVRKMDVTHKTGVLVIGGPSKTEKLEKEFGGEQQIQDVEFGVDDGSEGEK